MWTGPESNPGLRYCYEWGLSFCILDVETLQTQTGLPRHLLVPVPNHAEGYSSSNSLLPLTFTLKFSLFAQGFSFDSLNDVSACHSLLLFTVPNEQPRFCNDASDEGSWGWGGGG